MTLNQGARSPCTAFPLTTFMRKGSLQGRGVETSSSCKDTRRRLPRAGRKNDHCPKAGVGCGHRGGTGASQTPSTWTPKCLRLQQLPNLPTSTAQKGVRGLLDAIRKLQAKAKKRTGRILGEEEARKREGTRGLGTRVLQDSGLLPLGTNRPARPAPGALFLKEVPAACSYPQSSAYPHLHTSHREGMDKQAAPLEKCWVICFLLLKDLFSQPQENKFQSGLEKGGGVQIWKE